MISVIIPSVRDYRWKDIVEEFSVTKTDYEIIVCGPRPPQDLDPHFRAIQTNVKAAQCAEIAIRQSKGDYLFLTWDDVVHSPNILDSFLEYRLSLNEDLVILSPTFKQLGKPFPPEAMTINGKGTPNVPVGTFISRKDWNTIGGVDRNFIKSYWDHDVAMRCWSMGGKVIVLPDVFMDEIIPTLNPVWISNGGMGEAPGSASFHQDRPYLLSLWTQSPALVNGKLNVARLKPFEPLMDSEEDMLKFDCGLKEVKKGASQHVDAAFLKYVKKLTGVEYGSL